MWYCDCTRGKPLKNVNLLPPLTPTKVNKDDACMYCDHIAYWGDAAFTAFQEGYLNRYYKDRESKES